MIIDFRKVDNERVGYLLERDCSGPRLVVINKARALTFKEFIPPYADGAEDPREVYKKLSDTLTKSINLQNSIADGDRYVMLEDLAAAALQREAIRNAMTLIRDNYF